jgi:hypothetical protein
MRAVKDWIGEKKKVGERSFLSEERERIPTVVTTP